MKEKKERFSQVSDEVAEQARHCKTHEELMQLLKDKRLLPAAAAIRYAIMTA